MHGDALVVDPGGDHPGDDGVDRVPEQRSDRERPDRSIG
jgi:hypothetical protein